MIEELCLKNLKDVFFSTKIGKSLYDNSVSPLRKSQGACGKVDFSVIKFSSLNRILHVCMSLKYDDRLPRFCRQRVLRIRNISQFVSSLLIMLCLI